MKPLLMLFSTQILFFKNHMNILIITITTSIIMAVLMMTISSSHWFSFLLILTYVSGIMVLFMFIVSLAPNEQTQLKPQKKPLTIMFCSVYMISMKPNMMENMLKISSFFHMNFLSTFMLVLMILLMAYLPPKLMKSPYKGMKSSK